MKKLLFFFALILLSAPVFAQLGKLNVGKLQGAVSGGSKVTAGAIDVLVDDQNSHQSIPEGTEKLVYRCYLNPEVANVRKSLGASDYTYQLGVQVISSDARKDLIDEYVFVYSNSVGSLENEVSQGYLDVESDIRDLVSRWKDENGVLPNDELTLKVELVLMVQNAVLSSSKITTKNTGGWEKGEMDKILKEYKPGGKYYETGKNAEWKRMLTYSKNHFPDAELVHLKVMSTSIDADERAYFDVALTMIQEGELMRVYVSVWENKGTTTLSNYVPQQTKDFPASLKAKISEFQNVK